MQINGKACERQDLAEKITNFDLTLPSIQSDLVTQTIKDPYLLMQLLDYYYVKEKITLRQNML